MTSSFKPIVGEVLLYGDKCLILFVFCMVITAFLCLFYSALIEKMHSWLEKEKKPITQILRFMASSQLVCNKFIAMLLGIQQPFPFFFISLGDRLVRPYHPRPYVSPLLDKVYYFDDMIFTICHFKNERDTGPS